MKRKKQKQPAESDGNSTKNVLDPNKVAIAESALTVGKKVKAKDKVHYVNGKEFEEEIRQYYKSGNITEKLGESLTKIANGLSYAPNFINYSYKDDMIGDAIVKMFSALRNQKFRLDTGFSPFSYFTTIAFHAFINRIKKENKHHAVLNEYRDKVYTELMLNPDDNGNTYNIYIEPADGNYNSSEWRLKKN